MTDDEYERRRRDLDREKETMDRDRDGFNAKRDEYNKKRDALRDEHARDVEDKKRKRETDKASKGSSSRYYSEHPFVKVIGYIDDMWCGPSSIGVRTWVFLTDHAHVAYYDDRDCNEFQNIGMVLNDAVKDGRVHECSEHMIDVVVEHGICADDLFI